MKLERNEIKRESGFGKGLTRATYSGKLYKTMFGIDSLYDLFFDFRDDQESSWSTENAQKLMAGDEIVEITVENVVGTYDDVDADNGRYTSWDEFRFVPDYEVIENATIYIDEDIFSKYEESWDMEVPDSDLEDYFDLLYRLEEIGVEIKSQKNFKKT
jgi:hypothetical protein